MRRQQSIIALTMVVGATVACSGSSPGPAIPAIESRTLSQGAGGDEIIVTFRRGVGLAALSRGGRRARQGLIKALRADARRAQAGALAVLRQHGIQPSTTLWLSNSIVAKGISQAVRSLLAGLPGVESIRPNALLQAPAITVSSGSGSTWNLDLIRAPELWAAGHRGGGTVVASLDTGVDVNHPDLAAAWRATDGWFDPYLEHATPADLHGHGTQSMGLIVGGSFSGTPTGVAPDARWIAAKIFNDDGLASLSAIHQALQWVLDPDDDPSTDDAADVVNNSWGFADLVNECYLEFEPDIAALRAAGVAVVFSAGNAGPAMLTSVSPANNPSAFAVGGVDDARALDPGSSRGPDACGGGLFPELVAPGVNVRTTDLTSGGLFPDSYTVVSGTSFAAPHVSGAISLLLGVHPSATVTQLEQSLTETASDLGADGPDTDYGNGLPDVVAAESRLAALVATPSCTDTDADGYFAQGACGTAVDCDDGAASIHPGACDVKSDGVDQDCDGADRTKGKPCPAAGDSGGGGDGGDAPTGKEGKGKTCGDGVDNDGDGKVDCADSDCASKKSCA